MTLTRRVFLSCVAVAAGLLLPALAASASATKLHTAQNPAGCGVATSIPAVWHHANAVTVPPLKRINPCITFSFKAFGEGRVVATNHDVLFQNGDYGAKPVFAVARSVDGGQRWQYTKMPTSTAQIGDPRLSFDRRTNRVIATQGSPCARDMAMSDDDGSTWRSFTAPSSVNACPAWDFVNTFEGPPRISHMPTAYPDVMYYCANGHVVPATIRECWKSLDGGKNWREFGGSNAADLGGLMGAQAVAPDGTVYGADVNQLAYSLDEGDTWSTAQLPPGVVSNFDPPQQALAIDERGTVYIAGLSNSLPEIYATRDRGKTWLGPWLVQMPGVHHVETPTVTLAARGAGQVVVTYIGNADSSDVPSSAFKEGSQHHGYITMTDNLFAKDPLFVSVQVDPRNRPLMPYGWTIGQSAPNGTNRADYLGVDIDRHGRPWAYFPADECADTTCATPDRPFRAVVATFSALIH